MTTARFSSVALVLGVLVPFVYFGLQLAAAPFYPGYDFLTLAASELGSNRSPAAAVFNLGIFALGAITLVSVVGFTTSLRRLRVGWLGIGLVVACLIANGLASLWAAANPLPSPQHAGPPALMLGMIGLPVVLLTMIWRVEGTRPLKIFLVASISAVALVLLIQSGTIQTVIPYGIMQRILALAVFGSIGMGAYSLLRTLDSQQDSNIVKV